MTYCVIARCARTGKFGIAAASYTMAIGAQCDGAVRPNIGATMTLGAPLIRNNRLAMNSLAAGYTPAMALGTLEENDPHHAWRQIGIVDREGTAVAHTGANVRGTRGQRVGSGFLALGSMLASENVLDALVAKFEQESKADLDDRLLATLEAGRDAGGLTGVKGALKERSVVLLVWDKRDYSEMNLRVDFQPGAIAELREMYTDYKPTADYYEERAKHPRNAIPAMEFADMLKKKQKELS